MTLKVHVTRTRCLLAFTCLATLNGAISGRNMNGWWLPSQRAVSSASYPSSQLENEDLRCSKLLSDVRLTEGTLSSKLPPDVTGLWLSQRCETRPGPEFLLRKYLFHPNRTFELLQFYYSDHLCSVPEQAIHAEGSVQMTTPSWTVPGGMETDYVLTRVQVLAYTTKQTAVLSERLNRSTVCGHHGQQWLPKRWYTVYKFSSNGNELTDGNTIQMADVESSVDDFDCLDGLGVVFHELQLMRVELRKSRHRRQRWRGKKTELLLGDAVYDHLNQHYYRPTSYQPPLLKNDQVNICAICRLVNRGSDIFPPHLDSQLTYQQPQRQSLHGEWVSTRCETRPFSMFLTRHFVFYDAEISSSASTARAQHRWKGVYRYFLDARCRKPSFSLVVRGQYQVFGASKSVEGATDVDFRADNLVVTPHTVGMVNTLNDVENGRCGVSGSWRLSRAQDVTSSNGCLSLGLIVPMTEFEIFQMELDRYGNSWMYLGGRNVFAGQHSQETNNSRQSDLRPSSYQLPLLQCRPKASLREDLDNSLNPIPDLVSLRLQAIESHANLISFDTLIFTSSAILYFILN